MNTRFVQYAITIIILVVLSACSSNRTVREIQGQSKNSPPGESSSYRERAPRLASSLDGYDQDAHARRSSNDFPRPRELEPQIRFWRNAYANWSRSQVAIHDKLHMNLIYEVLELPGEVNESLSSYQKSYIQERMSYWRSLLGGLEDKLSSGIPLRADEQHLVSDIAENAGDRNALFGAGQRLRYQRGLKERFRKGLAIGSQYDRRFRQIFRDAGLPEDLALLPHVESSFQANAHSSAGALGIWQFTAGAARIFMNDDSAEARLDPIASTYGAARYLSSAYDKLGSWPLAITSYNHGIGGMQRAKSRHGHDFASIVKHYDHPQFGFASRNYYAEFLAARDVISDPDYYFREGGGNSDHTDSIAVPETLANSMPDPEPQADSVSLASAGEAQADPAVFPVTETASVPETVVSVDPVPAPESASAPEPAEAPSPQPAEASLAEVNNLAETLFVADPQIQDNAVPSPFVAAESQPEAVYEVEEGPTPETTRAAAPVPVKATPPAAFQARAGQKPQNVAVASKPEPAKPAAVGTIKPGTKVVSSKLPPAAPIKAATNATSKSSLPVTKQVKPQSLAAKEKPAYLVQGKVERSDKPKPAGKGSEPIVMAKNSIHAVPGGTRVVHLAAETHSIAPTKAASKNRVK